MFAGIQFSSFGEFLDMGQYTFEVWSVYGLFVVFLLANTLLPWQKNRQIIRQLKRRVSRDEKSDPDGQPDGLTG